MYTIHSHRRPREEANETGILRDGWSDWVKAIEPNEQGRRPDAQFYTERPNGFTRRSRQILDEALCPGSSARSEQGIYEWQARKSWQKIVVYIGSTDSPSYEPLTPRIRKYCTAQSNIEDKISSALKNGYELWVRVREIIDHPTADRLENELLGQFDYAWNEKQNGIRNILPISCG